MNELGSGFDKSYVSSGEGDKTANNPNRSEQALTSLNLTETVQGENSTPAGEVSRAGRTEVLTAKKRLKPPRRLPGFPYSSNI